MVRVRLLQIPLERDEGEYAFAGQLLLHGTPPYREAFNMKFPGVYAAYALIMAIFGQTIGGIHLGFLLCNAATIVLVFLLGKRLFGATAGAAAGAAYALLSLSPDVFGTQAHATHFVVLPMLAASLLLLRAIDTGRLSDLFSSGLLYGTGVLMKQHGVFFAIFGAGYLLWDHWTAHRESRAPILRPLAVYCAGLSVPLALTAVALWMAGVFGKFWFWTFTYAREYVTENALGVGIDNFEYTFPRVVGPSLLLWLFRRRRTARDLVEEGGARHGRSLSRHSSSSLFVSRYLSRALFPWTLLHSVVACGCPAGRRGAPLSTAIHR